ncbi:MAG TPA: ribose-phosphate diphosphokinase [Polyangia bacterium]|nr:ribose-phosphate diphosphokinase [Polyangia bacterium]
MQLGRNVNRRDVVLIHSPPQANAATELYSLMQAVAASRSNGARSVRLLLDPALREAFDRDDFLRTMFAALGADSVEFAEGETRGPAVSGQKIAQAQTRRATEPRAHNASLAADSLLWGGGSHPALLEALAKGLRVPGPIIEASPEPSGDAMVRLPQEPRGKRIYLLQTKRMGRGVLHADQLEMLRAVWQAKQAGASEVTVIMPYLPYSRSDRKDEAGTSVGAAVLPRLMQAAGVDRVVTFSLHQPQEVGIFEALGEHGGMRVVHASGEGVLARRVADEVRRLKVPTDRLVVIAPDAGASKRAHVMVRFLAAELGLADPGAIEVLVANKRRSADGRATSTQLDGHGRLAGAVALIIDDETATGGTLESVALAAAGQGASLRLAAVSHLTGPAHIRLQKSPYLDKLFVTDTLPQDEVKRAGSEKIEVVSIAPDLAKILRALDRGGSTTPFEYLEK